MGGRTVTAPSLTLLGHLPLRIVLEDRRREGQEGGEGGKDRRRGVREGRTGGGR